MAAAAASVAAVFTAVVSVVVAFAAVAFVVVAFAAALTVMVFATMVLAVIGSAIETSMIGSSLAILGTRSFTIPIHTTDTIPMAIILTVTDTSLTMSLFTKAGWDTATLWLERSNWVWRVKAIIMARSMA